MRIKLLPAAGFVMSAMAISAGAESKTTTPVKIKPGQIGEAPYRYNGAVVTGGARGSGFCAWNRHTFFTAAHVVFEETAWADPPTWYPGANSELLDEATAIRSRGYYRWTDYASLATATEKDDSAFSKDVALAFSFKKLIKGKPALINLDGDHDLRDERPTLITGYPADNLYSDKELEGFFLHKTGPVRTPYKSYDGKALITPLVSTGHGNSGGPIWTKNVVGEWIASGVVVGGLPSETVVYAFSGDINSLLKAVRPVVREEMGPPERYKGVSATSLFYPNLHEEKIPDGVHDWSSFNVGVRQFDNVAKVSAVRLSLDIRTKHRGDLQVLLEAPGGYQAVIHNEQGAGKDDLILRNADVSERFTGIAPNGVWRVRVQDRLKGDIATFKSFVLEISVD